VLKEVDQSQYTDSANQSILAFQKKRAS